MQAGDNKRIEKVREEHCTRVFERYENKSKNFRTLFIGLVGFALVFFFFILFPYVSIHGENYRITERLENLRAEIDQREERIDAYRKAQDGIQKLQKQILNGPSYLREFILSLTEESDRLRLSPIQRDQPLDPCGSPGTEEWVDCKVQRKVQNQFLEYGQIFSQDVIPPLQNLEDEYTILIDSTALKHELDSLQAMFETKRAENPRFWKTFNEKAKFYKELVKELKRFWSKYDFEGQRRKLEDELKNLRTSKDQLDEQEKQLAIQKDELADRLKQIEFPLGKLPVGLIESVLLFPVVLAIGFLLCTSLFCETTRLRRVFHNLYQKKDPSQTILTDRQVSLVAPLWIDPANPEQNQTVKFTILLTPFVVFVVAIGLIFYSWTIPNAFSSAGQLNRWVYGGLYVLSLGVFIYGCWQVITELRRYSGGRPKSVDEAKNRKSIQSGDITSKET